MGYMYDHVMIMRIFTLIMNKVFMCASKTLGKWQQPQFRFANHLVLIASFMLTRSGLITKNKKISYGYFTRVTTCHRKKNT